MIALEAGTGIVNTATVQALNSARSAASASAGTGIVNTATVQEVPSALADRWRLPGTGIVNTATVQAKAPVVKVKLSEPEPESLTTKQENRSV